MTLEEIKEYYKRVVKRKLELPTTNDLVDEGVTLHNIRSLGGLQAIHRYIRDTESDFLDNYIFHVESVFDESKNASRSEKKKFIVTTAVADSKADVNFIKSLRVWAKENDAQIVIMPCESVTNSFEKKTATFDPVFNSPDFLFVHDDTELNENISLCSIQISAKQVKPITGLNRLNKREGSYVFASPKQFLEYIPSGNNRGKNYSIMTPGACTLPSYYTDTLVSKRLSYIAQHDHTLGAIIIEIKNDKLFDFRQIQSDENGSFIDLGKEYHSSGVITYHKDTHIIFGDVHSAQIDWEAYNYFKEKFIDLDVKSIFLHDIFDGLSINHHANTIYERQERTLQNKNNLEQELRETYEVISKFDFDYGNPVVNIVKSNHDEFLERYLKEGRYIDDPENHYFSLFIAPNVFYSGKEYDTLKKGIELAMEPLDGEIPLNWIFLQRSDSLKISDVECAAHGDLGLNGAKASLNTIEKVYGNAIVGHNHSAAIQRGVFRVGTISKLDMGYNRGPSSWTQTCCLLYENGQRQLINFIRET